MTVPIYINNRNYLTPIAAMVDYLADVPGALPIIVDNESTYPPLLTWYAEECPVEVVFLGRNAGARGWQQAVDRKYPFHVGTDPDLDLSGVPLDVLELLRDALVAYPDQVKVGLSLEIEDLPVEDGIYPYGRLEDTYWQKKLPEDDRFWQANLDMTFSMYRAAPPWRGQYGPALRSDRPYTARHLPWYWTKKNMTDEERYYVRHCESRTYLRLIKDVLLMPEPT